jgi:ribosomal protein S12 methylthiotransferase
MTMDTIYIDTLGCFKNLEDSERAAGLLETAGYRIVDSPEAADVILVNTCGFIEDAKRESIERILQLAEWKEVGKHIIVSGCLAQRYAGELSEELPEIDTFIGVNDYENLPEILRAMSRADEQKLRSALKEPDSEEPDRSGRIMDGGRTAGNAVIFAQNSSRQRIYTHGAEGVLTGPRRMLQDGPTAYLKVAEGCSNRCSYCAIPLIRGAYRSVPIELLVSEAERLCSLGRRELVLIAQDVSAYGIDLYGRYTLPKLLKTLCDATDEGIWIRLMYCYEERINPELIQVIASEEKICAYLDIPLQHYADNVLRRMGRRSTSKSIRDTIQRLRETVPGIALRTTLMTGFPGETEADFQALEEFVSSARFERLGVFAFSPEEGTLAAGMPDQVPSEIAEARRDKLMLTQMDISLSHNRALTGRCLRVITEYREEEGNNVYVGRSEWDAPEIDGSVIFTSERALNPGDFVDVEITDGMDYDLIGREKQTR